MNSIRESYGDDAPSYNHTNAHSQTQAQAYHTSTHAKLHEIAAVLLGMAESAATIECMLAVQVQYLYEQSVRVGE